MRWPVTVAGQRLGKENRQNLLQGVARYRCGARSGSKKRAEVILEVICITKRPLHRMTRQMLLAEKGEGQMREGLDQARHEVDCGANER